MRIAAIAAGLALSAAAFAQQPDTFQLQGHAFRPQKVEPTDERVNALNLPEGFKIQKFAEGLGKPRMLAVGPRGQVYVSRRDPGDILMLVDTNGDGKADLQRRVARIPDAHGLAVRTTPQGSRLFIATVREVLACDIAHDGSLSPPRMILGDLPDGGQHPNRTIAFGPDDLLYISIGSTCNACEETNPEAATIVQAHPQGRMVYARGLRNTIGFGWHPRSGEMWGMDHGTDWLGDDEPKEELNKIVQGAHYGWPYIYNEREINQWVADPSGGLTKEDYRDKATPPTLMYTAHAAPLGMIFYTGDMFPPEYRGDAFVTNRGSWNRKNPAGYNVVRIRFDAQGKPERFEDFITGFLVDDNQSQFARPCGITQGADGALLFSDDDNGVIYRVSYGE